MKTFNIGDKIRFGGKGCSPGEIATITDVGPGGFNYRFITASGHNCYEHAEAFDEATLILRKGQPSMTRRTFKLLKETPDAKKGALYQEDCDDGTQDYSLITAEHIKYPASDSLEDFSETYSREAVEKQPKWFIEVFQVLPEYATKEEIAAFKTKAGKKVE
jgi:hypothetical protein